MNERDKLLRKSRKSPLSEFYKADDKQKWNAVNISTRRDQASYYEDLLQENSTGNPSKFWRTVKSIYPGKAKNSSSDKYWKLMERIKGSN